MQSGNGAAPLNPGLVFEMVQSQQKTAALKAAIDLDVFRAVGKGPGDVASIARHCSASERGIRILCDFLVINGVLVKEDGRYTHTPTSAAFLDPRSPACMGHPRIACVAALIWICATALGQQVPRRRQSRKIQCYRSGHRRHSEAC